MNRDMQCQLCGNEFMCRMGKDGCWCEALRLTVEALDQLRKSSNDCVCANCLLEFAKQ